MAFQFKTLKDKISEDSIVTLAAAIAFYTAFALPPIIILLMNVLVSLNLNLQEEMLLQIQALAGTEAVDVVSSILSSASERPSLKSVADFWGIGILLFSATIIFAQLQSSLNQVFDVDEKKSTDNIPMIKTLKEIVFRRLICAGMILTFIFVSIVSLMVSAGLSLFADAEQHFWGKILQTFLSLLVFTGLFFSIFKWMPDKKVSMRAALWGGGLTSCLFMIGKVLIGIYLSTAALGSAYGAAGSLVVLFVWVYYSSLIVLFGAEIAHVIEMRYHSTENRSASFSSKAVPA